MDQAAQIQVRDSRISTKMLLLALLGGGWMAAIFPFVRWYGSHFPGWEVVLTVLGFLAGWRLSTIFSPIGVLTAEVFLAVLAAVALVDGATMEIPDQFQLMLLGVTVVSMFTLPDISIEQRLLGAVSVSVPMLGLCFFIDGAFGGGDIKLVAICGLFLGWKMTLTGMFLAILAGGSWGAWLLIRRSVKRKDHFAFGPFLCGGMAVALLWGEHILAAYWGIFY